MTKYFTNFEDSDVGDVTPVGWTRRAAAALTPDLYGFSVENGSPAFKKRQVRATALSSSTRSAITYDAVGDISSSVMLLLVKVPGGSPTEKATSLLMYSRGVGGSIGAPITQALIAEFNFVAGTISVYSLIPSISPDTTLLSSVAFSFTEGESYFLRFRQFTGNVLQVKAWLASAAEPSAWLLTQTGFSITTNGWVGWGVYSSSGTRYVEVACVSVWAATDTSDDTAQTPLTNVRYSTWLASVAERCVLAEMQTVGYDVVGVGDNQNYLAVPASTGSPSIAPANTPDSVANSITGDIDLRIKFRIDSFIATPGGARALISKYASASGANLSYELIVLDTGIPRLVVTPTGASGGSILYLATEAIPGVSTAEDVILRSTLDINDGAGNSVADFYYSIDEGESWIPLGSPVTQVATTIFDGNTRLEIGGRSGIFEWYSTGRIWWMEIRKGIDGRVVVQFDPTRTTRGVASFTAATGEIWTIPSPASITAEVASFTNQNVYLANMGYASKSWDSPASQPYRPFITKIPTFRREMSLALSEKAATSFGVLGVANPRQVAGSGGVRDDWLRAVWRRNYIKQYLGDPSWPKHDFRLILLGRLQPPRERTRGEISFEINDLTDAFDAPISSDLFTTGDYVGQVKPRLIGEVAMVEPPLTDSADLVYTINDGPIEVDRETLFLTLLDVPPPNHLISGYTSVYDDGVEIKTPRTLAISAVDTGTDTITANQNHGMVANYRVTFLHLPPAPLVEGTWYYVIAAGLTATAFRVSATVGGAAINLTATGGGEIVGIGAYFDEAAGTMTLVESPVGRVTVGSIVGSLSDVSPNENLLVNLYDTAVFRSGAVSRNFKDNESFDALTADVGDTYGLWIEPKKTLVKDVLTRISRGSFTWYGFSCDGLFQVGLLRDPRYSFDPSIVLVESDVLDGSLVLVDTIRHIDIFDSQFSYRPWFLTGGTLNNSEQSARQGKSFLSAYGSGPLLLDPDADETRDFDTLIYTPASPSTVQSIMNELYGAVIGIFEFRTRLKATELTIGDTIKLTHSRYGWKLYSATDPPSPGLAHPEAYDMRLATVIAIDTNLSSNDPFPVRLKVYRQIAPYRFGSSLTGITYPGAITN